MGVLETWLDRRRPAALLALETYYKAWTSGEPPNHPNPVIEGIKELLFHHATHEDRYRLLINRALLKRASPDHLTSEDLRQAVKIAREMAMEAAENALRGKAKQRGRASLASHVKTEMRKALRVVLRSYGIPLRPPAGGWPKENDHIDDEAMFGPPVKRRMSDEELAAVRSEPSSQRGFQFVPWKDGPSTDNELEAARRPEREETGAEKAARHGSKVMFLGEVQTVSPRTRGGDRTSGTTGDADERHGDDIARRPARKVGHGDFYGMLADGHSASIIRRSATADSRPYWVDWTPEELCVQCGGRRTIDPPEFMWKGDLADLLPQYEVAAEYVAKRREQAKTYPFCSHACEHLFGGPAYAPDEIFLPLRPRLDLRQAIRDHIRGEKTDPFDEALKEMLRDGDGVRSRAKPHRTNAYRAFASDVWDSSPSEQVGPTLPERREDVVAKRVLNPLEYEIWTRRNDGYGTGGRHLAELVERGIKDRNGKEISPANYRKTMQRVKTKVRLAMNAPEAAEMADLARRVFAPEPEPETTFALIVTNDEDYRDDPEDPPWV